MSEGFGSWNARVSSMVDMLKRVPENASALGKQGYDAIKNGAAMPGSAAEAGKMAGNAVNSAEAGVDAAKTAASNAADGFKQARGISQPAGPVSLEAAMSGQTAKERGFRNAGRTPGWTSGTTPPPTPPFGSGAAPMPPAPTGTAVEPWNPVTGQRPGPVLSGPQTIEGTSTRVGPTPTPSMPKDLATAGERLSGAGTGGIPPEGKPGFIRNMGGKAARFAGKASLWAAPVVAGAAVLDEAGNQMGTSGIAGAMSDQARIDAARTADTSPSGLMEEWTGLRRDKAGPAAFMGINDPLVQNRIQRLKGMGGAALNALNPLNLLPDSLNPMAPDSPIDRRGKKFGVPQTGARTLAQQPVQAGGPSGPGMIQTNQGMQTPDQLIDGTAVPASGQGAFRRTGGQGVSVGTDGALFGGKLQPLSKDASPEEAKLWLDKSVALQNSEVQGRDALRKDLAQINARNPFDTGGSGPANAIAGLAAYGAMSRMQKNEADLGVRQDANATAKAKIASDIAIKNREDLRKTQEVNRGTMDKELEDYGRVKAGPKEMSELPATYEGRVKAELSKVRQDINYSLGNRKDGRKLEDLEPAERQQLLLAKSIKDKVADSRGGIGQKFRDYFGNKQFDSKDLYSYMPKAVEPTLDGGYKVLMANGNTMTVSAARGGGFNLTGPNDPVDADIQQLISPLVDKYEKSQKGK
jgi:hypothetical protein